MTRHRERRERRDPPAPPSRPASGRPEPAIRSPSRSGCWAPCSGQVITEQAGRGDLRPRRAAAAGGHRLPPGRRPGGPRVGSRRSSTRSSWRMPRRSSRRSPCTSSSSTSPRRAARVRTLRRRERAARDGLLDDSVAEAVARLRRAGRSDADLDAILARLRITPVLTAHPTEARRRTTLVALRRCAVLLERLDDPRLTPSEDREIRRRLREEITLLWRTSDLRAVAPEPLDEVRTAMAVFDATLFTLVPRLYRAVDAVLDARAPGRVRRACRRSCGSVRGSAAIATATRPSPPR